MAVIPSIIGKVHSVGFVDDNYYKVKVTLTDCKPGRISYLRVATSINHIFSKEEDFGKGFKPGDEVEVICFSIPGECSWEAEGQLAKPWTY